MAMSSQFYRDMSKVEKKFWGISRRLVKAIFLYVLVSVILVVEVLFLPDWAFYIVALVTSFALGTYPTLLLLNKWREKKRQLELQFLREERTYQTYQIRRYSKDEFIAKKTVKETDRI